MKPWAAHRAATRRAATIAGATVAVLAGLPPLFGQFFYAMDLTRVNLGLLCAIKERFAADGSLQLSSLLGNGGPLLARPDAQLFYLPRWIALAFPPDWGSAFEVVLHLSIAAAATAWLVRSFGVRVFTAAAAGIAFALSGTVLDLLRHAHYLVAAAWLPLLWVGARETLRRRSGWLPPLAVFFGLSGCLLGAEPQSFAVGVGLIALELVLLLARRRRVTRRWVLLGACCIAAFLVGLAQWAPTLGEMALTPRSGTLPQKEALAWSMTAPQWLGVVLPGMPSQYVQGVTTLMVVASGSPRTVPPWNKTPYLGALLVCAALAAIMLRKSRSAGLVALGGTLFALGDQLPILPLLMKVVPFLARFRYPAKYWLVASLAIVVLAAIGLDAVSRSVRVRRRFAWIAAAIAVALAVLGGWLIANSQRLDLAAAQLGQPAGDAVLPTLSQALKTSTLHAASALVIAVVLLRHGRLRSFLFGLVLLDLIAAVPFAVTVGPPLAPIVAAEPAPSSIVCVNPGLAGRFFPFSSGSLDRSTLLFLRAHLLPELQACSGVRSPMVYSPLETSAASSLAAGVQGLNASAIRSLGCTHFLSGAPFKPDVPSSAQRWDVAAPEVDPAAATAWLFELPDPLAPAFVAHASSLSPTEEGAIARVARSRSRDELIQVADDPLRRLGSTTLPAGAGVTQLGIQQRTPSSATVEVSGTGGAVIGVRTPFLVGWSAAQAGRQLPVIRIAGHQLGAVVDDVSLGAVVFQYRAPNLGGAVSASLAGLALLGVALALTRCRRARAQ